jgi:phospholipid/cholesterol/gamma-HCH transport system substrate-binding protein
MRLTKGSPALAGAVLIVLIAAAFLLAVGINTSFGLPGGYGLSLPPTRDYVLRAAFDDAAGLSKGASVQVAGTPVGQVTDVTASGRRAVVAMRIKHEYAPMHQGTIARIRFSTLLAQKYVELAPSAGTPVLADGATIPSDQTITPVDFDQFLSTLDPQTRQQVQVLVQELGGGVEGRAATLNLLLDQLSGLTQESRGGLDTLNKHDADLSQITADLATTSGRLAQSRTQLGDLVANTAIVTGTLTANDRTLDDLLVHLAGTSRSVDATLNGNEANLNQTAKALDPFLAQLNANLGVTQPYLHAGNQEVKDASNFLIPYIGSAISERDGNGNFLREYIVVDTCFDQRSTVKANPKTGAGCLANLSLGGPAPPGDSHASSSSTPATGSGSGSGSSGTGKKPQPSPTPCASPSPGLLPPGLLPSPLPIVCPNPTPCTPTPGQPTPTPTPTPSPSPTNCIPLPLPLLGSNGVPQPLPSGVGSILGLP